MPRTFSPAAWLDSVAHDVGFARRAFHLSPLFSFTAVVTLGLGIAAVTTVVSIVDATLFRPLPFPASSRVVEVSGRHPKHPDGSWGVPVAVAEAFREVRSFDASAMYDPRPIRTFTIGRAEGAAALPGVAVSRSFFDVFGARPSLGRTFAADEEDVARPGVGILTDAAWKRLFAANPAIVGQTVPFVEGSITIIGVMPETFWYPLVAGDPMLDLVVPRARRSTANGPDSTTHVAARLSSGATMRQAQAEADMAMRRHGKALPDG